MAGGGNNPGPSPTHPLSWGGAAASLQPQVTPVVQLPINTSAPPHLVGANTASTQSAGIDLVALAEHMRRLQDDVNAIRDQMESEAVEIASETFKSKGKCGVWLTTERAEYLVYLFVDAISFLSLCTCNAYDNKQEAANSRATSVKVRDANTYHTAFIASYLLEVPPLFGKGTNADVTRATGTLAAVPTFEDFYPGGGKEGVKDRLTYLEKIQTAVRPDGNRSYL